VGVFTAFTTNQEDKLFLHCCYVAVQKGRVQTFTVMPEFAEITLDTFSVSDFFYTDWTCVEVGLRDVLWCWRLYGGRREGRRQ
jgi:hypothetical protein